MNPLVNNSNRNNNIGNIADTIKQTYSKIMENPGEFLSQLGIPQNITTPHGAVQYLLQSGKITQTQINQAQNLAKQIKI